MAGRLIGPWNPSLDANGAPISGAKLVTWQAGTTTPKQTFSNAALTVPNTNPVLADSAGRFPDIWAADGATYDLNWTDASNVQIKLFQNIQALGSTATGAVTRDFGADGRFNLESRGGVFEIEAGDPSPDNLGGTARIGGWAGSQGDTLTLDFKTVQLTGVLAGTAQRGAIGALTLSAAGATATFGVAVGQATDSTGTSSIILPSAFTKTTSAWAVGTGNGSLDTGTVAINTWYHVYLIKRLDSGLVDVLTSLNPTSASPSATPTLPAGYTLSRRIGAMKTDGSSQWRKFVQKGDQFAIDVPTVSVSGGTIGTTPGDISVDVPVGIKVIARVTATVLNTGSAVGMVLYDPDTAGSGTAYTQTNTSTANAAGGPCDVWTSTSATFKGRASAAASTFSVNTLGWIDPRGKDL